MRNTTLKKALSIFLAVLMIALALPFTLLTASAEDEIILADTVITKVTSTSDARTTGGVTYALDWAWDGDLTTTYLGKDASKRFAVTDGVFGSGSTYQDYITVEFNVLSNLKSFTIWGGSDKASQSFTNNEFDVYYSADGETWNLHSEHKNVCGDGTNAKEGSAAFTEVSEDNFYGLKLDMNNAVAKYVRIAVKKGRMDRGWSVLRDVEVDGTEIHVPVSVAGIQQNANGDVRLIGVTDSMKVEGVGFKLDATYTREIEADNVPASFESVSLTLKKGTRNDNISARYGYVGGMIDGDLDITYGADNYDYPYFYSYGTNSYVRTYYYDQETGKIERDTSGEQKTYHGYAVFELAELSTLNSVTVWLAADGGSGGNRWSQPEMAWNICDAYDILISTDGETWTLMGEFENMCGDNTNKGENFPNKGDDDYDEKTLGRYLRVGHKIDLNEEEAAYVAFAIKKGNNEGNQDVVIGELSVDGTVVADTITETKTATITTDATNVVFDSILADGKNVTAKDIDSDLYSDGHKLYALGITGIPTNGNVTLEVTPYFVAFGSTVKVYGDSATFEFIDGKAPNYSEKVKVMSYNICNQNDDDLGTLNERYEYIAAQINSVEPDIVILNEAHEYGNHLISQDLNISKLTGKCTVNYGIVEFKAEESSNVILYNTEKYTLIKSEYLDLGYGKDGEFDAEWKRDAVIAKLERISDNREIVAVATHISTSNYGTQIGRLLMHVRDNYGDVAYRIVAGDLNIQNKDLYGDGSSTGHKGRFQNPDFTDISYYDVNVIANGENVDTTSTFPSDSTVLDYIYTTNFTAKNYQVLTGANASKASDHNAVYAELTLN